MTSRLNALRSGLLVTFRVEIANFERVSVRVMEIGVPAWETVVAFVGIFDKTNIARPQYLHGSVELLFVHEESVVVGLLVRLVRIHVIGHFGQDEITAVAFHE